MYVSFPITVEILDGTRGDQLYIDTVVMECDKPFNEERRKERGNYLDRSLGALDLPHQFFSRPGAYIHITFGIVENIAFRFYDNP